jgi:hypothetical protein
MKKALTLVLVLMLPAIAFGDLLIVEKVSSSGAMGMWESHGTETTYIKGEKVRTDSEMKVKGMMEAMMPKPELMETHIVRLDKDVIWTLSREDSTYTEIAVKDMGAVGGDVESSMDVRDIKLTRTGDTKKIAGYKCEGILIEALIDVEAQGRTMTMDADALFWAAKEDKKLAELMKLWEGMMGLMDIQDGGGFGSGMKALWDKFNEIEGVPLGMELTVDAAGEGDDEQAEEMKNAMKMMKEYMKGAGKEVEEEEDEGESHFMVITREVVSVEEKSHSDDVFEIPAGFTKVKANMPGSIQGMPIK